MPGKILPPNDKEDKAFKKWRDEGHKSIDIPYSFNIYGVQVSGIIYVKDNFDDTYTDGNMTGTVNGTFHVDRNQIEVDLYDPAYIIRGVVYFDVPNREFWCRIDTKRWDGGWNEGDHSVIYRG